MRLTLIIMLWLAANIIAIVQLVRIIIESVKHGKTERLMDFVKKFFIAFIAAIIFLFVGAGITPHPSPKPTNTDAPAATISAEPSAVAETPAPTIEVTPTPSATPEPTPSATPSSTPAPIASATPTPTVEVAAPVAEEPNVQADVREYVLNTNSHKFHNPSCGSVDTMDASNRQDVTTTRDELIAQGYEPCKRCNP